MKKKTCTSTMKIKIESRLFEIVAKVITFEKVWLFFNGKNETQLKMTVEMMCEKASSIFDKMK